MYYIYAVAAESSAVLGAQPNLHGVAGLRALRDLQLEGAVGPKHLSRAAHSGDARAFPTPIFWHALYAFAVCHANVSLMYDISPVHPAHLTPHF